MRFVQSAPSDERRESRLLAGTITGGVGNGNGGGSTDSSEIIPFNGYDRKALDVVTEIPLLNTLGRLQFLTSTSPRVRERICGDGGLDRLLEIVNSKFDSPTPKIATKSPVSSFKSFADCSSFSTQNPWLSDIEIKDDGDLFKAPQLCPSVWGPCSDPVKKRSGWIWLLAFHCICNIGIRGSEYVRCRVVDAGALPIIVKILETFMKEAVDRLVKSEAAVKNSSSGRSHRHRSRSSNHESSLETPLSSRLATVNERSFSPFERISTPEGSSDSGQEADDEDLVSMTSAQTASTDSSIATFSTGIVTRTRGGTLVMKTNRNKSRDVDEEGDITMTDAAPSGSSSIASSWISVQFPPSDNSSSVSSSILPSETLRPNHRQQTQHSNQSSRSSSRHGMTSRSPFPEVEISMAPGAATRLAEMNEVEDLATPLTTMTAPSASVEELKIREDDILLCLQLLAYLSKYPNVRAIFHDPDHPHLDHSQPSTSRLRSSCSNVFSVVEKFTYRPSRDDKSLPKLSQEIQYWACVIMRNACRKDDSKGGIRQCANMDCGVWEKSPREFAKCRRCRKAKYCSKTCQSKAWSQGHRYWCTTNTTREDSGHSATPNPNEHRSSRHHHHHHEEARDSDSMEDRTPPPPPPRQNPFFTAVDQQFLDGALGAAVGMRMGDVEMAGAGEL